MDITTSSSINEEDGNEIAWQRTKLKHSLPFKKFVRANGTDDIASNSSSSERQKPVSVFGNEIKKSYLQIVGSDSQQAHSTGNISCNKTATSEIRNALLKKSNKKKITLSSNLNVNSLMKAVEANNVKKVKELVDTYKNFVLNVKDQYGWNALMCACCAGAKDVVNILLKLNPDLNVTDKKGNTCLLLAKAKGHNEIVKLINDHILMSKRSVEVVISRNTNKPESKFCEVCKETISEGLVDSHFTSTVHLFNASRKSGVPTSYGIPENNVGFQMLLKTGWDKERGLGPEGSGHKFPPKTMLKQDRTGLGAKKYVPRITHDPRVIVEGHRREKLRTLNRRQRLKKELRNKNKEIELRRMLN